MKVKGWIKALIGNRVYNVEERVVLYTRTGAQPLIFLFWIIFPSKCFVQMSRCILPTATVY